MNVVQIIIKESNARGARSVAKLTNNRGEGNTSNLAKNHRGLRRFKIESKNGTWSTKKVRTSSCKHSKFVLTSLGEPRSLTIPTTPHGVALLDMGRRSYSRKAGTLETRWVLMMPFMRAYTVEPVHLTSE